MFGMVYDALYLFPSAFVSVIVVVVPSPRVILAKTTFTAALSVTLAEISMLSLTLYALLTAGLRSVTSGFTLSSTLK